MARSVTIRVRSRVAPVSYTHLSSGGFEMQLEARGEATSDCKEDDKPANSLRLDA